MGLIISIFLVLAAVLGIRGIWKNSDIRQPDLEEDIDEYNRYDYE